MKTLHLAVEPTGESPRPLISALVVDGLHRRYGRGSVRCFDAEPARWGLARYRQFHVECPTRMASNGLDLDGRSFDAILNAALQEARHIVVHLGERTAIPFGVYLEECDGVRLLRDAGWRIVVHFHQRFHHFASEPGFRGLRGVVWIDSDLYEGRAAEGLAVVRAYGWPQAVADEVSALKCRSWNEQLSIDIGVESPGLSQPARVRLRKAGDALYRQLVSEL